MTPREFLARLDAVKRHGNYWMARCPAHEDDDPSLKVSGGDGGRVLLKCFAGCEPEAVVGALGLTMADLFAERKERQADADVEAVYSYRDEGGELLFQVLRKSGKKFVQRKPDGAGGWAYKLNGARRALYRLPELLAADGAAPVFIPEGEKSVDRLLKAGLVATCSPHGAGKWRAEYGDPLRGRPVVILPDNDQPGRDHATKVERALKNCASSVRILPLEGLPPSGDVFDWLDAGHDPQELLKLAAQPDKEASAYACVKMSSINAEKVEWLWKPYLPLGKITLLDGWPGIGKSWLTCKLASIVTRGGGFPNGVAFKPGNVLMFSAEDGLADTLRPRLDACGADVERVIALNFLEKDGLAIFDTKGLIRFEATIIEYKPRLVIIDPLFAFTGGAVDIHRANECREVSRVLAAIAARQRCNLLCVRHLNKSGGGGSPMKAGIGSIDWLAAARVGLLAGCDPDDEDKRALTNYKNNLAGKGVSLGYSITFDPDTDEGSFEWIGESDLTAERILAPAHHEDSGEVEQRVDAEQFLRTLLQDGRQEAAEVERGRRAAAISEYSLKKAKIALGIEPYKEGGEFGGKGAKWYWELPVGAPQDGEQGGETPPQDGEKNEYRHLVANDSGKSSYGNGLPQDGEGNFFNALCDEKSPSYEDYGADESRFLDAMAE